MRPRRRSRPRRARRRPRGVRSLSAQGKKPRAPRDGRDPFAPKPKAQRNFTDPESKIMKTSDGSFHQCYYGPGGRGCDRAGDRRGRAVRPGARRAAAQPALEQLDENLAAIGAELPDGAALTADAGYFSEENVTITTSTGLTRISRPAASSIQSRRRPRRAGRSPTTPPPSSGWRASSKPRRAADLQPAQGDRRAGVRPDRHRPRRPPTADPRQQAARAQWRFECMIHNLLKLHRNGGLALIGAT